MRQNPERRMALIDAAIEVLADQGARGLTFRAVDNQAGVPIGTASNYFPNRDALLTQAGQRVFQRLDPDAAVVGEAEHERIVATSSYHLDPRDQLAEVAYMVEPGWQGSGLATALHARTVEYARSHGVRGLSADVLMNNLPMMKIFRRGEGYDLHSDLEDGIYEVRMLFV